ncbi:MAG: glycosyltransferase, partial [Acidobacteriota bacterium]
AAEAPWSERWGVGSRVAVTVCGRNHLAKARVWAQSLTPHDPALDLVVVVVDAVHDADGALVDEVPHATVIDGRSLGVPRFGFLALRHTTFELCAVLKPSAVLAVLAAGAERVLFCDADLDFHAAPDALFALLERHAVVVSPHSFEPFPDPDSSGRRPTMRELSASGVLNSGLFGVRAGEAARGALERWRVIMQRPGFFAGDTMDEQRAFNWLIAFVDDLHVLRDRSYNVAYWNLHDRSLRARALDGGSGFTVDGEPLVCFHWSGYSAADPWRLSRHDRRYSLYALPSVARLADGYARRLVAAGELETLRGAFDRLPSGVPVDDRLRQLWRGAEPHLDVDVDPWTDDGEAMLATAMLQPQAGTGLLPLLLHGLWLEREDFRQTWPDAPKDPAAFIAWFAADGAAALGYQELWDRWRPTIPKREGLEQLAAMLDARPQLVQDLASPLGTDRPRLIERLRWAGSTAMADAVANGELEYFVSSPLAALRSLARERRLRVDFPDLLDRDAERFAEWIEQEGEPRHLLPAGTAERFRQRASGRALARIFLHLQRRRDLQTLFPLALVGEKSLDLACSLLDSTDEEYDADDVVVFLWTMDEEPWVGVPLALEQAELRRAAPTALSIDTARRALAPVVAKDPRFARAIDRFLAVDHGRRSRDARLYDAASAARGEVIAAQPHPVAPPAAERPGVNLFAPFASGIGLGGMARGLDRALQACGVETSRVIIGSGTRQHTIELDEVIGQYRAAFGTNLFLSYPHAEERPLELEARHVVADRRNIAYLAWEQRDGHHFWPDVYAKFDQIWALSSFAARSLERSTGRPVQVVPCALEVDRFPEAVGAQHFDLDGDRFSFLYVFDASSSIERKNPFAALDAFARAFRPDDPVRLIFKVSNARSTQHGERLRQLVRRAASCRGLDIRFWIDQWPHAEVLRLISAVDCYVSLHHSEGFGYTCAEAMAYGKPVVASGYSGNLEFMSDENSFLVETPEAEVTRGDGPFQRGSVWGEPSVEHAAELMRLVVDERDQAVERGRRAAEDVRRILAPSRIGEIAAMALAGEAAASSTAGAGQETAGAI